MEPDLLRASGAFLDRRRNIVDSRSGKNFPLTRTIARELDRIGIPRPSLDDRGKLWFIYLRRLAGEAKAGAIAQAKMVWGEIQKEQV